MMYGCFLVYVTRMSMLYTRGLQNRLNQKPLIPQIKISKLLGMLSAGVIVMNSFLSSAPDPGIIACLKYSQRA